MNKPQPLFRVFAFAAVLIGLSACDALQLKENTPTFLTPGNYFQDEQDVIAAANGMYDALMTWNLWVQPAWISIACENDGMLCENWMAGGYPGNQASKWYIGRPWTGYYEIIMRANFLLENTPSLDVNQQVKDNAMGQAYFLRGFSYFALARRYGAVPLRTEVYDPGESYGDAPRAPLPEVYARIVEDLKKAADLLPRDYQSGGYTAADHGRPTAPAAWGMLANAYLHMAGHEVDGTSLDGQEMKYYGLARDAAQKVMQMAQSGFPSLEPDYKDLFEVGLQDASSEILFSIQAAHYPNEGPELPRFYSPRALYMTKVERV